jgi:hypothetical protein
MLNIERELELGLSADQVWEWMSDLRNIMLADQFHTYIDCDSVDAKNPRKGLSVPIMHDILGFRSFRVGHISRFEDYAISWGESLPADSPAGLEDPFPHSEGWSVQTIDAKRCILRTHLRGRYAYPIGKVIGDYVWQVTMPTILDNDLQEVAVGVGAIAHKHLIPFSPVSGALVKLVATRQFDGVKDTDFFDVGPLMSPPKNRKF